MSRSELFWTLRRFNSLMTSGKILSNLQKEMMQIPATNIMIGIRVVEYIIASIALGDWVTELFTQPPNCITPGNNGSYA